MGKTVKNPCAVGVAVRCEPRRKPFYGTASFTCLIFDPVENPPVGRRLEFERLPETASNSARDLLVRCCSPCFGKADTGLHGSQSGLHLQGGTLVFTHVECDLFAFERGGEDFVPSVQGQTFFALRFIHGR